MTQSASLFLALFLGQIGGQTNAFSAQLSVATRRLGLLRLADTFYNDFEGYNEEDDDDDDFLLVDDRDWRTFRKNLSMKEGDVDRPSSVSKENEEVLESQSKSLYKEYKKGIWAHETPTVSAINVIALFYWDYF